MNISFNPNFTGRKNKCHSNLAVTAGLASAMAITPSVKTDAQNNKLQERFNQFITAEFQKADTSPTDYYVTEEELSKYLNNSDNIQISDYDMNNDKKLNIDEFKKIILGVKNNSNKVPNEQAAPQKSPVEEGLPSYSQRPVQKTQTTTLKNPTKSYSSTRQDARNIISKLYNFRTRTETTPGRLWGTNTRNLLDFDAAYNDLKNINADNLIAVVKEAGRFRGNPSPTVDDVYIIHTDMVNRAMRIHDKNKHPYCDKVAKYLGKVMDDYATKHNLHYDKLDECLAVIRGGYALKRDYSDNTPKLEKAYKLLMD